MYITISPQKLNNSYPQSVSDFVDYLEKENEGKIYEQREHFFNQHGEEISPKEVIKEIDGNTAKLKKTEPKFYSITVNPSRHELNQLGNDKEKLKSYTREVMKSYAEAFNREIDGRKVTIDDILYYAKIEQQRTYKGTDKAVRENTPYRAKIARLQHEIVQIKRGEIHGNIKLKEKQISKLMQSAPYKLEGKMIKEGMIKEGPQTHIHIIVSRKDQSNTYSLSPGSKYVASDVEFNGKQVKRGFNRDQFFKDSEKTFDRMFNYKRNYVETYMGRKDFNKDPSIYFANIMNLPTSEKMIAFKLIQETGMKIPYLNIPVTNTQLAYQAFKKLKLAMEKAIHAGSIGI